MPAAGHAVASSRTGSTAGPSNTHSRSRELCGTALGGCLCREARRARARTHTWDACSREARRTGRPTPFTRHGGFESEPSSITPRGLEAHMVRTQVSGENPRGRASGQRPACSSRCRWPGRLGAPRRPVMIRDGPRPSRYSGKKLTRQGRQGPLGRHEQAGRLRRRFPRGGFAHR